MSGGDVKAKFLPQAWSSRSSSIEKPPKNKAALESVMQLATASPSYSFCRLDQVIQNDLLFTNRGNP